MGLEHGGKIALRLQGPTGAQAVYTGELSTPERCATVRFVLDAAKGSIECGVLSGEPPEWLLDAAHAILRTTWRGSQQSGRFPRRIQRWREHPDARPREKIKRRSGGAGAEGEP